MRLSFKTNLFQFILSQFLQLWGDRSMITVAIIDYYNFSKTSVYYAKIATQLD